MTTFFREAGVGPGVVCIHSNASSSSQWRALMDLLAPGFHVLAGDSYGAGKGPPWPSLPADRKVTLRDEADLLEPLFAKAGDRFTLVGHSYGAAVAMVAAAKRPSRVRALAVYEPTLFSLIDAASPPPNDADGIKGAVAAAVAALKDGKPDSAAEAFIDYWMGKGAWAATPEARRGPIAAAVANVQGWADALVGETTPLSAFQSLNIPVLYMTGGRTTASAKGVAKLLSKALPNVQMVEFEKLGHMGPVTHPDAVNPVIANFLDRRGR